MTPGQLDALVQMEQWVHRDPSKPEPSSNPAADFAMLDALMGGARG